jgi:hypothetical protein
MTASRDPDRLIHGFLLEGEEELQDQVYDAVRAEIELKRQRAVSGLWRTPTMNKFITIGLGAAAVVVLLFVGVQLLGSQGNTGSGGPSAASSATPETATPQPSVDAGLPVGSPLAWLDGSDGGVPITITIPAPGWTGDLPAFAFLKNENANPPDGAAMFAYTHSEGWLVPADACHWESTMPDTPSATVDELVAALSAQASRDASAPVDISVDGHAGKSITLHVPDPMPADCDVDIFCTMSNPDVTRGPDACERIAQGPGQIDELWIVDVDGSLVLIDAAYYDGTPDEDVEEQRDIVDSITFEAP